VPSQKLRGQEIASALKGVLAGDCICAKRFLNCVWISTVIEGTVGAPCSLCEDITHTLQRCDIA
jgi:hypothetical protein